MSCRFTVALCLSIWAVNISLAQETIELVIDQSRSSVVITLPDFGDDDISSITGTAVVELDTAEAPFSTARLTELNMTMADGFTIVNPIASVAVNENGANVFFAEIGPTGIVNSENQFDQFSNLFGITGMAFVSSGLFNSEIDLATVDPIPFDIAGATLSTNENQLTLTTDIFLNAEVEFLVFSTPLTIEGEIVMTGELPASSVLGDINCDGVVDLFDVGPFVDLLTQMQFDPKADINGDAMVDLLDVQPFVELLAGG